jgi:hypothetical protein
LAQALPLCDDTLLGVNAAIVEGFDRFSYARKSGTAAPPLGGTCQETRIRTGSAFNHTPAVIVVDKMRTGFLPSEVPTGVQMRLKLDYTDVTSSYASALPIAQARWDASANWSYQVNALLSYGNEYLLVFRGEWRHQNPQTGVVSISPDNNEVVFSLPNSFTGAVSNGLPLQATPFEIDMYWGQQSGDGQRALRIEVGRGTNRQSQLLVKQEANFDVYPNYFAFGALSDEVVPAIPRDPNLTLINDNQPDPRTAFSFCSVLLRKPGQQLPAFDPMTCERIVLPIQPTSGGKG